MANSYTVGASDVRPWGKWIVVDAGAGFAVKRITVNSGGVLSLQRHRHRAESWTIVAGVAEVTLGGESFTAMAGETVEVPRGQVHRIANTSAEPVVFIEVQMGGTLDENDIERLEDRYGRT